MTVDELLKKTDGTVIVGDVLFSNENDKWYAHPIEIKREESNMTNREWLESLSDKELAKSLGYVNCDMYCVYYNDSDKCRHNSCEAGITEWLQEEHKEPKKGLTAAQLYDVFRKGFQDRRAISLEEAEKIIKGVFEDE